MIKNQPQNPSFPVSYFDLFCLGLTNLCRSLYFGMDIALKIAEFKLQNQNSQFGTGIGLGDSEHVFLFNYIKFIVHQHIADVDFSDCMIDWYDMKLQPSFMAPLTSRGKKLVHLIHNQEVKLKSDGKIPDTGHLHAAQEGLVELAITPTELQRIDLINKFESEYARSLRNNS